MSINKFFFSIIPRINENNTINKNTNYKIEQYDTFFNNDNYLNNSKILIINSPNIILKNLFNSCSYLNSQEIDFGNYYVFDKHALDSGSYGTVFLGCQKNSNLKVAIKQIKDYDLYQREKEILIDIRSMGNFPVFYDSLELHEYCYIIESLTGPSLDVLLDICNGKFDFLTTINIGIDIITQLEILHKCGYIHRDLKPNNIWFNL